MTQMAVDTRGVPAPDAPGAHILRCLGVRDETANVRTFLLEPAAGEVFGWAAGQYLTLGQEIDGAQTSRCYSISSTPSERRWLEITVKRLEGGLFSNWMHENLRPGQLISAHGPLGGFTPSELRPAQSLVPDFEATVHVPRYLFLGAGSGMTPIMAILRSLLAHRSPLDAVLVNSLHGLDDMIFQRDLEAYSVRPGLRVELVSSTPTAVGSRWGPDHPADIGVSPGRLDPELLRTLVPDLVDREIFCCGPAAYLVALREMLVAEGCEPRHLHEESFDIGNQEVTASTIGPGSNSATTFTVSFARSGRSVDCPAGSFILDAALQEGIPVPSSCGVGMCGTCKSSLVEGTVEMNHSGGIRPREIAQGKILLCCSRPMEDLVIDA